MKILLFLLLTIPVYSQVIPTSPTPCDKDQEVTGRQILKIVKQFKPAYKKAEIYCAGDMIGLAFEAKRVDPQRLIFAAYDRLKPEMESLGLTKLLIEGRAWDKVPTDNAYYRTTPIHVITTRTGSTSYSTITGGNVVRMGGYSYHRNVVSVLLEETKK